MVNGKTPLYLTVVAAALLVAAVLLIQPYSADFPGTAYAKPAHRYLQAAISQDSVGLTRLSASAAPVIWALGASRTRPDSLAAWKGHTEAWTSVRRGDTTDVLVFPAGEPCSQAPIVLRFVRVGDDARVVKASSTCFDPAR
jgi:hypothetical protein